MELFLALLLAHLAGDFCFQPKRWVDDRMAHSFRSSALYKHVGVHALCTAVMLGFNPNYYLGFLAIVISHWLIDILKAELDHPKRVRLLFVADQLAHLAVIIAVTHWYEPFSLQFGDDLLRGILLLAVCVVIVTYVGAIVIQVAISRWTPDTGADTSLAQAGRVIGMLERLFVFGFVATGHWEGVGFLLAAKSVFRFGDLKESRDRKLTEYVLIGTLISFGLAILTGMFFVALR